ncbi:MAG: hypothetical protein AAGG48_14985 [Planctomycetota bacterium]
MKNNPYTPPTPEPEDTDRDDTDGDPLKSMLATLGAFLLIVFVPAIVVLLGFQ